MAKEVAGLIKLQIKGGAANPSPPVGPALGSKGINIMEFCKQFNARTQDKAGKILPVIITYYADKSFDFVIKTPPVAIQGRRFRGCASSPRIPVCPSAHGIGSCPAFPPPASLPCPVRRVRGR